MMKVEVKSLLPAPPESVEGLRAKYRTLVWSNPEGAPDESYILAALRRGNFVELRDFAYVFGLDRLRLNWAALQAAEPAEAALAAPDVERILRNLQTAADRRASGRDE